MLQTRRAQRVIRRPKGTSHFTRAGNQRKLPVRRSIVSSPSKLVNEHTFLVLLWPVNIVTNDLLSDDQLDVRAFSASFTGAPPPGGAHERTRSSWREMKKTTLSFRTARDSWLGDHGRCVGQLESFTAVWMAARDCDRIRDVRYPFPVPRYRRVEGGDTGRVGDEMLRSTIKTHRLATRLQPDCKYVLFIRTWKGAFRGERTVGQPQWG